MNNVKSSWCSGYNTHPVISRELVQSQVPPSDLFLEPLSSQSLILILAQWNVNNVKSSWCSGYNTHLIISKELVQSQEPPSDLFLEPLSSESNSYTATMECEQSEVLMV